MRTVQSTDHARVMELFDTLKGQIDRATNGEISFSEVISSIDVQKLMPAGEMIPTKWSIDDIRDRFPFYTTDEQLIEHLNSIEKGLHDAAVSSGWDVITFCIGQVYEDQDEPILHIDYLTPRDKEFIEKHIYPTFNKREYPLVENDGNQCHVVPEKLWDTIRDQIVEWNLKYKLHLTADFYHCKTSELKRVG